MATFDPAPDRANRIIRETIDEWFPDLVEANVKIGAVFAYPAMKDGKPKSPAMKSAGRQVLAKIKANNDEERAAGAPDLTITLDAREWERLEDLDDADEQLAGFVGDRLEGVVVEREMGEPGKPGPIKTNDQGRAVLGIRPYDYVVQGWKGSVEKFGARSPAKRHAREFHDDFGNLLFDFAGDRQAQPQLPGVEGPAKPKRKPRGAAAVAASRR